jgi:radical SAM protein with 4Fe4S-binding SPASM domain
MKYTERPITAVWELTFACNLRCKHCGSSCSTAKPDELTEDEALNLCDQIGQLGIYYLTLSGGEPLLCKHWNKIAKRLKSNNVIPNMITNAWLLTRDIIKEAKSSGISNIAISLDGLKDTHDFMRTKGSFDKIMNALDMLKEEGMPSSIITTVNNRNLLELRELYEVLVKKGVSNWQLQYAMAMGNMLEHKDLQIIPEQIDLIIDFAYEIYKEGKIRVDLSDCVGYYNIKETEIRNAFRSKEHEFKVFTNGCPAGKMVFGIRCNGNIVGCTSLRDEFFLEDNVRNRPLKEIWEDPKSFAWNRDLCRNKLEGFCSKCQYGNYCLAGCSVMKFTSGKKLTENHYCSYNVAVKEENKRIQSIKDLEILYQEAETALKEEEYQLAEIYYSKLLTINQESISILNTLGFINFQLENFNESLQFNKKVLSIDPKNAYAYKGLGLCQVKLNQKEEGIKNLYTAIDLADNNFIDPYHDLAVILAEEERFDQAINVLELAKNKFSNLNEQTSALYKNILEISETNKVINIQ